MAVQCVSNGVAAPSRLCGQMFMYESSSDRLLLCLEPVSGHHPVTAGVERRVLGAAAPAPAASGVSGGAARIGQLLSTGSRRVVPGGPMTRSAPAASFTGQGHTLGGSAPAPAAAATAAGQGRSREEVATLVRVGPWSVVLRPAEGESSPAPAPVPAPAAVPAPAPAPVPAAERAPASDGGDGAAAMDMS